jgi:tetratricopeptide (TPR) repeat protein
MFEFGRDLRRRLSGDSASSFPSDGLTRGDGALLELLDLSLLQAEARAADTAAGRISCRDIPSSRLTAAGVWLELARRSGDAVALRKAAAHAGAALDGFERDGRTALAARARCEQAAAGLLGAELFGDDGLTAAAAITLKAAARQTGVGAALAQALLAGLNGRVALASGAFHDIKTVSAAFETPLFALETAGRRSAQARLAAAAQRLVRADLVSAAAARLKDRTLAVEALADLKLALQRLDATYEPLLWARAQTLKGATLALLGELEADIGLIADGVEALAGAVETVDRDHSPLDWARAQVLLGQALVVMGELSANVRAFDQAVSCFDRANAVLKDQPALALRAVVASQRAGALARCAELTGDIAVLDAAEAAYRGELASGSPEKDPVAWAVCQTNLARLYETRAELTGRDNGQRAAAAMALSAAFDVFAEHGLRSLSDMTLQALERVRSA